MRLLFFCLCLPLPKYLTCVYERFYSILVHKFQNKQWLNTKKQDNSIE
jgi:hypothetical protein